MLLGIRCPETDPNRSATTATGLLTRLTGGASGGKQRRDAAERLAAARPGIEKWQATVARSSLHGAPAAAGMIAWSYAREVRRTALPVPDTTAVTGPMLAGLCHGDIDPTLDPRFVRVTDLATGSAQYVSILTAAAGNGFPAQDLELPGGEWLEILTDIPGVEASVRGVNHGQVGSRALLDRGLKTARSQVTEAEEAGAPVPGDAVEALDTLTDRRAEVQHRHDVEGTHHARWVVTADTPESLAERVAALQQRYDGIVQLQQVPHIQDLLWKELLPGRPGAGAGVRARPTAAHLGGVLVPRRQPLRRPRRPLHGREPRVLRRPRPAAHRVPHRHRPDHAHHPGVHRPLGRRQIHRRLPHPRSACSPRGRGRCWWTTRATSPGSSTPPAASSGVTVQEIDVLHPSCAGTMDPMRFAPTADEARTLTLDVLLGALSADDRRRGETVLEAAIDQVLAGRGSRGPAPPSSPPCTTCRRMTRTQWWRRRSRGRCGCGRKPRNSAPCWATCTPRPGR